MWTLSGADVAPLALGAALLGSGGGGRTATANQAARQALEQHGSVPVLLPTELDPDDWVVPIGLVGSVTVFEEKPPSGDEWRAVLAALERYAGHQVRPLMPFEAAGVNALLPIAAARATGRPLVDADLMGRAFPGLDQTTLTLNNLQVTPMALANEQGWVAVIDRVNPFQAERLARSTVVTMGGWAAVGYAPQRAADVARCAIRRSISSAVRLGRQLQRRDLDGLLRTRGGRLLFRGKVVQVERDATASYGRGSIVLDHLTDPGRQLTVEFQNENLIAVELGRVVASVPDLICTLGVEDLGAVTTEEFQYGLELNVVRMPCPPNWRTPAGLGLVGPSAFGYRTPYVVGAVDGSG